VEAADEKVAGACEPAQAKKRSPTFPPWGERRRGRCTIYSKLHVKQGRCRSYLGAISAAPPALAAPDDLWSSPASASRSAL